MAKQGRPPSLGRIMSVSLWRNGSTGETDGSMLIAVDVGYACARTRIAGDDIGELVDLIVGAASPAQRETIKERLARRFVEV